MFLFPAFLPILVSSLVHQTLRTSKTCGLMADAALTLILWNVPPYSILVIWRWVIKLANQWTKIPGVEKFVPQFLIHGGPLGSGCYKVVEVLTGCLIWKSAYPSEPLPLELGPMPSLFTWLIVLALSLFTNFVLSFWSQQAKSRGDHEGVHRMVESSRGRTLSRKEKVQLALWAVANAVCEEVASRGLWMHEFMRRGRLSMPFANLLQAIGFGVWHFHGIPSGWTGVVLTFIYGFFMGLMFHHGGGLLLPCVAHSIADYFIFAVIARKGGF